MDDQVECPDFHWLASFVPWVGWAERIGVTSSGEADDIATTELNRQQLNTDSVERRRCLFVMV